MHGFYHLQNKVEESLFQQPNLDLPGKCREDPRSGQEPSARRAVPDESAGSRAGCIEKGASRIAPR
jgi:hypothetical protein